MGAIASYAVFETPVGAVGVAWTERGIRAVQLPEPTRERLVERLFVQSGVAEEGAPPPPVRDFVERLRRHLEGHPDDFADVPLDLDGVPPFRRKIYEALRGVPAGATVTYGELAARVGSPGGARAVGQAMAKNPCPIVVPCHRVLAAGGRPGGFSAAGGLVTKARLLALEGATMNGYHP